MSLDKIYIGEREDLLFDVIEHLIIEFYESSLPADHSDLFQKISASSPLSPGPKLILLNDGYLSVEKMRTFISKNFKSATDYLIILSNIAPELGEKYEKLINNRIWILSAPLDTNQFVTALDKIFISEETKQELNYHRISFDLLPSSGEHCVADIFIKLGSNKYVKILNKDDIVESDFINKYSNKASKFLYIPSDSIRGFYENKIKSLITNSTNSPLGVVTIPSPNEITMDQLSKEIGVDTEVINLVNQLTGNLLSELKTNSKLSGVIGKFSSSESFSKNLSQLTSFILIQITKQLKLSNQKFNRKLIFSTIFCDLLLTDDNIVHIKDMKDPSMPLLSQEQRSSLLTHGERGSEVISNSLNFSNDEITIIEQHHERPNGSGFPKGFDHSRINTNAALFITAQEFAYLILNDLSTGDIQINKYLEDMSNNSFQSGIFSKYFTALIETIGKDYI